MCNECRQSPCSRQCPNSDYEPAVVYRCEVCNQPIYEGDDYYEINENSWCENCVRQAKRFAEVDE